MQGWDSEMQVVFVYPLPSILTYFHPILIENPSNPIRIKSKSIYFPCLGSLAGVIVLCRWIFSERLTIKSWMSGCLKSMICLSKILNFTFLNFLAIRLVPYSNLSHSLFNPHLSSLVPSKIVQVELEKHGFKFKTDENPKT